ncbi:translation initiation factor eIF-2B subunit epsilon-like protein [Dinothrombium tinctorium]|uniref:Translation initiation factor eIF2B subunit epsilon n=1 Tax=Dinothrombium tinctorium TaxID=1965070 RepID=A0A443R8H4_9ACAR|nr:translation initiation factor eIF-2B subunit epsilon-like protein [Dinothrombium tinctorium]
MSSKKKKLEEKQPLQAVLICDSFNYRFMPLTRSKPRVLIPLLNVPLIDYSLKSLHSAGFDDVFLFCCSHSQQIKDHIKQWLASRANVSMNVQVFSSDSYASVGDVLRDLDGKGLIRHDFVLLFGDCVWNLQLKKYVDEHRNQIKNDKGCIMTLLFKQSSRERRSKSTEDQVLLFVDGTTNKLLLYDKLSKHGNKVNVNLSLFQENRNMKVYCNLQDTYIAICSVNVPSLFADNFDYETRDDFIRGILEQEDILGSTIYSRICESNTYATRVINPSAYEVVSLDILQRWSFPIVPDLEDKVCYQRHNIYRFCDVSLMMNSILEKNVAIGTYTTIGANAHIMNSVIGSSCKIGNNVKIEGAFLWNNVNVDDDCELRCCIIGENVHIKNGCTISEGSLISNDVVIGPNVTLKCRLIQTEPDDDDDKIDTNIVGSEGKGYLYRESEEIENINIWGLEKVSEADESWKSSGSELDDIEEEEEIDDTKIFYNEVLDSFQRGFDENVASENLILEVNSSKHAYNIPIKELGFLVTRAVLEMPKSLVESKSSGDYSSNLDSVLNKFTPVIKNYIKSAESQLIFLMAAEEFTLLHQLGGSVFYKILKFFYDKDILEEDVILQWYENTQPLPALLADCEFTLDDQLEFRRQKIVQAFVKWLQEAEEESSDN